MDEVDGTFFTIGTTAPVVVLEGLVALGDCAREVVVDEDIPD